MSKYSELTAQGRGNVETIKALAAERYDRGYGWQVYTECYTDDEFAEDFGGFATIAEAVKWAEELAEARDEQYAAANAEAF